MKWTNFYPQFEKHFPTNPKRILEIGVRFGDGLRYLRQKFPDATIVGVDNAWCPEGKQAARECQVVKIECNQRHIDRHLGLGFDVVIDDGGHRPYQQSASFNALFPRMPEGGVYFIEDFHMNYRPHWRLFGLFFGIQPILRRLVARQNKWTGGHAPCTKSPAEIIFTPHLVMIRKGEVPMAVEA